MNEVLEKKAVFVYLWKVGNAAPGGVRRWGTLEAIASLGGCVPITRSARKVAFDRLDPNGFLPRGVSPDDP